MTTKKQRDYHKKTESYEYLQKHINEGDTIYYIVKRVSNSGMYRHIAFYKFNVKDTFKEGEDRVQSIWLTRAMCNVLGYTFKEQTECMGVNGCGMDMGFSVIHNLGHELFGDGYKLTSKSL